MATIAELLYQFIEKVQSDDSPPSIDWVDEDNQIFEYDLATPDTEFTIRVVEALDQIHYFVQWCSMKRITDIPQREKVLNYFMTNAAPPFHYSKIGEDIFLTCAMPKLPKRENDNITLFVRVEAGILKHIQRYTEQMDGLAALIGADVNIFDLG